MRGARASIATLVATLAVSLGAFGLAVAAPGGHPRMQVQLQAAGALGLSSSRDGETLFAAAGMRPGQAVSGTLRITNTGDAATILAVRPTGVSDAAGAGGGRLSGTLALIISDVSGTGTPVQLWAGRPADLAEARLAILAKGQSRDLVVTAALPAADNRYQGATISLGLTWGARPVSDGLTPTPTPTPTTTTPVVTPAPTPTPAAPVHTPAPVATPTHTTPPVTTPPPVTTAPAGTPIDVSPDELGLPSANACMSRRKFKIHLRAPHHGKVLTAIVRVGKQKPVRIKGRGRRIVAAKVNLRRFKKRTVVVKIDMRTADGHHYRSKRRYHVCAGHR
jgi:hypothetical protein